jgi:hypothetical protein
VHSAAAHATNIVLTLLILLGPRFRLVQARLAKCATM